MEQKKYRVKRSGWSGFFLFLFGILCGIIIVGLVGVWAYKSVSISKVESWFNVKVDLGSANGVKDMTIEELVALGVDYGNNINTLTLADLEQDFGITISSPISGIDMTSLKTVPIMSLGDNLDLITDQVTFGKLEDWFTDLALPNIPIITNNIDEPVIDAINTIFTTVNKGTNLTLADLKEFGVDLTSISLLNGVATATKLSDLETVVKNKQVKDLIAIDNNSSPVLKAIQNFTINELTTELPNLTIGEVIGNTTATTGIIAKIKDLTIGNLNETTLMEKVQTLTLNEVMNTSGNAILSAIGNSQIQNLSTAVNNISAEVILGADSNVLALLKAKNSGTAPTLATLPTAISNAFDMDTLTLGDLEVMDSTLNIPTEHEGVTVKAVIQAYLATIGA